MVLCTLLARFSCSILHMMGLASTCKIQQDALALSCQNDRLARSCKYMHLAKTQQDDLQELILGSQLSAIIIKIMNSKPALSVFLFQIFKT